MLGFYNVSRSSAFAPTETANPRLIYWPPTQVGKIYDHVVVTSGWLNIRSMTWSPSGRYLLIFGDIHEGSVEPGMTQSFNTLIIDMENGTLAYKFNLDVGSVGAFIQFAFSSDETKIFYVNAPYTGYIPMVYSVNLDGTNSTLITYMNSTAANSMRTPYLIDVTSDGYLIYTSCETTYNWTTGQYNYTNYIWKYALDTGEKSLIVKLEGIENLITSLSASPSSDKIAYANGSDIWVVDINGANSPVKVASAYGGKIVTFIDWTNNGTMLTYSEVNATIEASGLYMKWEASLRGNVTAVNVDGSNHRIILNDAYGLVWSPVNDSLAAYIMFQQPDYWYGYPYLIDFNMPITPYPDSDGDGLPDPAEIQFHLNPLDPTDLEKDYDDDGLTNREEYIYGAGIDNPDCDNDGLSDGVEVKVFKTNPRKTDTDGDGVADGLEAAATGLNAFVSVLPEGWIRMTLEWKGNRMYVSTNSSVLGVVFNSTSMALSISVGGPDGSTGIANISIPVSMISALSNVKVTLDDQPIDFQISQVGNYAQIYVQYHHSYHDLTAHLSGGGGIGGVDLTGILSYWWLILSVGIVAVASIIAAIIVKRG
ncbi:MAG: hypothetical protein QHH12_00155 [Candidatus Bathyarchaeota archaeon]|jgi:hypothetical protein|nr:hypothetical protein [Candidatus Bathyarchaeota archaeon A05DMB-3]MDH7606170.1 hypothetical protein [Candidatus Bathyarchaeota archaeon]